MCILCEAYSNIMFCVCCGTQMLVSTFCDNLYSYTQGFLQSFCIHSDIYLDTQLHDIFSSVPLAFIYTLHKKRKYHQSGQPEFCSWYINYSQYILLSIICHEHYLVLS